MASGLGSTGECHASHKRMARQSPPAGFAGAGHKIDDPYGNIDGLDDALQKLDHLRASDLRSVDRHRISSSGCRTELEGEKPKRAIPRHDSSHHAERCANGISMDAGPRRHESITTDLVGQFTEKAQIVSADIHEA